MTPDKGKKGGPWTDELTGTEVNVEGSGGEGEKDTFVLEQICHFSLLDALLQMECIYLLFANSSHPIDRFGCFARFVSPFLHIPLGTLSRSPDSRRSHFQVFWSSFGSG